MTKMAPRNRDESLESGALQLSSGTAVVVDMRGIGEGKLADAGRSSLLRFHRPDSDWRIDLGVRNLRHIATTIAQQKLAYEFPYSSFELETDLNFLVLSEGKAIVPVSFSLSLLSLLAGPLTSSSFPSFRPILFL
jgi:hypothetical protein